MYEHIRTYIQDVHKAEVIPSRICLTCITNVCQISEVDRATSPLITARNGWAENPTLSQMADKFCEWVSRYRRFFMRLASFSTWFIKEWLCCNMRQSQLRSREYCSPLKYHRSAFEIQRDWESSLLEEWCVDAVGLILGVIYQKQEISPNASSKIV